MPRKAQAGGFDDLISKVPEFEDWTISSTTQIATLWSNYGSIVRVSLKPQYQAQQEHSMIIKTVSPPSVAPDRADEGQLRKLLSYEVERWFYYNLSIRLPSAAKVATPYQVTVEDGQAPIRLLMEDLSVDYPVPARGSLSLNDTKTVLSWLATYHGTFWGIQNEEFVRGRLVPPPKDYHGGNKAGVWQQGTYWYLDTRRDEFSQIDEDETWLINWAEKVDQEIRSEAQVYGTLLHGDVKGANILFSPQAPVRACAMYDFQYVGIGLVTRDLVYFMGTSTQASLTKKLEDEKSLLRYYHSQLVTVIQNQMHPSSDASDHQRPSKYTFEKFWWHWELALVDWYRFMAGWGFWGNDSWVERRAQEITSRWKKMGFK